MAATGHAGLGCYSCHLAQGAWSLPSEKAAEILRMYPLAIVGAGYRGPVVQTSRESCIGCHSDITRRVTTGGRLRIRHGVCAKGSTCDTCHSKAAHGKSVRWAGEPIMENCIACHVDNGASTECETCHVSGEERDPRVRGPWQTTHGANWQKTHGLGQLQSCSTCHAKDYCKKCHGVPVPHPGEFGATHGEAAMADPASCEVCHTSSRFCDACHGTQMPHPAGFLKRHSSLAKGTADPACFRCHDTKDCDNCHSNHIHPGGTRGVPIPWQYTQGGAK